MRKSLLILIALATTLTAVADSRADFARRRSAMGDSLPCFAIFDRQLSAEQREALEFLYAYMPLPDITDYSGDFYLRNVDASLQARREMPWGSKVPEREFRHFVLPPRVNNEALDSARVVFYAELRDRVKDLSMPDAILEVNHWCHEKVTYQPSDARTSNPLATVRTALGRCGEESTFTVAALRAVGIPARQVYTPRWAHTDDNHAWVEAWADGQWHFLGACEPEAVLDLGWFNAPAARGMLMNTNAFGKYDGPEEVLRVTPCYTTINVTENYAPVDTVAVRVVDAGGKAIEGASVNFCIYNYAEYYPLARKKSDSEGIATFTCGKGDLVVWAYDGGRSGHMQLKGGITGVQTLQLIAPADDMAEVFDYTLVPPMQKARLPYVSPEAAAANERRKACEDSLRMAYTATFFTPEQAYAWASANGYAGYADRVAAILSDSRGNHPTLTAFLVGQPDSLRDRAVALLENVSLKDRRDITRAVLDEFITVPDGTSPLHGEYVLNPRIMDEALTLYRSALADALSDTQKHHFRQDPACLVEYIKDHVALETQWNPLSLTMAPATAWQYRRADRHSLETLFVAMARNLGIPARIDLVSGKVQYSVDGSSWLDAPFGDTAAAPNAAATLQLDFTPRGRLTNPVYYTHFTLSEIMPDGSVRLMEYPEEATAADFAAGTPIAPGRYMLTTGQRMANGSVLAHSEIFSLREGDKLNLPLTVRRDTTGIEVIGSFNSESLYHDAATATDKSLLSTSGRGYYVLLLGKAHHEPTIHALRDISAARADLEKAGRPIFILGTDPANATAMAAEAPLPANATVGNDIDGSITAALEAPDLPVVIIADTFNRVVYRSDGYTINLGDRLCDILSRLGE